MRHIFLGQTAAAVALVLSVYAAAIAKLHLHTHSSMCVVLEMRIIYCLCCGVYERGCIVFCVYVVCLWLVMSRTGNGFALFSPLLS